MLGTLTEPNRIVNFEATGESGYGRQKLFRLSEYRAFDQMLDSQYHYIVVQNIAGR